MRFPPPRNFAPGLAGAMKILIAILLFLAMALPASAADIQVSSTCTLNNAIRSANTDTATGGCTAGSGDDNIILTGNLTLAAPTKDVTLHDHAQGQEFHHRRRQ